MKQLLMPQTSPMNWILIFMSFTLFFFMLENKVLSKNSEKKLFFKKSLTFMKNKM